MQFKELEAWLSERIKFFEDEHLSKGKALKDYALYQKFKQETSSKQESYDRLCAQLKMSSQTMAGKEAALMSIETKWQKIGAQVSFTSSDLASAQILMVKFANKFYFVVWTLGETLAMVTRHRSSRRTRPSWRMAK